MQCIGDVTVLFMTQSRINLECWLRTHYNLRYTWLLTTSVSLLRDDSISRQHHWTRLCFWQMSDSEILDGCDIHLQPYGLLQTVYGGKVSSLPGLILVLFHMLTWDLQNAFRTAGVLILVAHVYTEMNLLWLFKHSAIYNDAWWLHVVIQVEVLLHICCKTYRLLQARRHLVVTVTQSLSIFWSPRCEHNTTRVWLRFFWSHNRCVCDGDGNGDTDSGIRLTRHASGIDYDPVNRCRLCVQPHMQAPELCHTRLTRQHQPQIQVCAD